MEEIMTQETNQATALTSWWNEASFAGKEMYSLKDNGELVLHMAPGEERTVATVTAENADMVLKVLSDKFSEVEGRMKELQTEWDAAEDKLKVLGKVERMREYLKHTNAVGNFSALLQPLSGMEKTIGGLADENNKQRLELAQKAEELAGGENWKETTQAFKDLIEQWRKLPTVDKHRSDELWNRLEAARTKFYERKQQHNEDVNKEMLANLDLKLELVDKAEKLAASEDWKATTESFKQLMEDWKKIGRTTPEKNEELWNRFIAAKNVFYDRKKGHFETIQVEQEGNYKLKLALLERAEGMKDSTEWGKTAQAFTDLMEEWKNIGRVPLEKADEMWGRLIAAKEQFFNAKKHHTETMRVTLDDNYAQKMALLKRAEALQNSNQWREATAELNELMDEWKKIGPVPREHSNKIWEQFIAARKKFFERKDANRERRQQRMEQEKESRSRQAYDFRYKLEEELREEEERLADFKNGIENITPGRKAEELREHLTKLIKQTEHKIEHKKEKLDEINKQIAQREAGGPDAAAETPEPADNNIPGE
ncbi:DUF349 domain-containing protein [Polluticoccus soli]|uniref:DUF349 domain-containing protein n=1 Tax=Polluticoccus soli TaxID=3034150 RepID=UPI0023E0AEDB|nr:DUF349 domain-containing protein [Flavipsychrobacter sp. JY13-12]